MTKNVKIGRLIIEAISNGMPPVARGSSDYWANLPDTDNPFPEGSTEAAEWLRGWMRECDQDARDMFDAE